MERIMTNPVNFTETTIKEIKRLMQQDDFDASKVLRVGVKGGGCTGLTYVMGFENRGFTFKNPNASATCGCGTSFAV